MARDQYSPKSKIILDYGPFQGYTDKSISPLGNQDDTTLCFERQSPGSEWHIDAHCRLGITPIGLTWVVDCFRNASQWAAKNLCINGIRGFDVAVNPVTTEVYASGGESDYFSEVTQQSKKILSNVANFKDQWKTFCGSIQHKVDHFCEASFRLPLTKRLHVARMIQLYAWRSHFWFYFALRAHYWLIMKSILQTGISADSIIKILAEYSPHSSYEICPKLSNDVTFECMANVDPLYGIVYRREVLRSGIHMRHARWAHVFNEINGDIERLLEANYIWWSSEHHRYIEWIAGIPFYHTLFDAGKMFDLSTDDLCFCFYVELQNALSDNFISDELINKIFARKKEFQSKSTNYPLSQTPYKQTIYYQGVPLSDGFAHGVPIDRTQGVSGILVVDDLAPHKNISSVNTLGIIAESCSELSHIAIAARQNGIPCVGGLRSEDCSCLRRASYITVDGVSGTIKARYS